MTFSSVGLIVYVVHTLVLVLVNRFHGVVFYLFLIVSFLLGLRSIRLIFLISSFLLRPLFLLIIIRIVMFNVLLSILVGNTF